MRTQALLGMIAVALRAATLVCQSLVIGGVVFHRWIITDDTGRGGRSPGVLTVRFSAIALAIAQALYLGTNWLVLNRTIGLGLADMLTANFFMIGVASMVAALAVGATPSRSLNRPGNAALLLSLILLACGVLASHAASRMDDRAFLIGSTALHHLAAAVWIGGLPQLWFALRASDSDGASVAAQRFSRLAVISVVALLASGALMSFRYVDSLKAMYGTAYGVMLAVKVVFFAVLLSIGAINRLLVRSADRERAKLLLRRLLEAEIGIGITAILTAASLTSQPPAADLKAGRVSFQEIVERMRPAWPTLSSPAVSAVSASSLQAQKQAEQAGLPPPPPHANTLADMRWSEFNHHWAGVFVLLMGLFSALAQTRRFPVMRYWPLVMVGLAALILLRADPEGWPNGPDSFFESMQDAEVLQHKTSALLVLLFAVFELRVQRGKAGSGAAYVFPAVCAIGGAVLLTHSHALDNIKEQLLAELSHVPLAIAAVLAGWSRWLQLRLPCPESGFAGRLWPVCFVVIGAILLNYREA